MDSRGKRRILKYKLKFFTLVKLEKGNYFGKGNYGPNHNTLLAAR